MKTVSVPLGTIDPMLVEAFSVVRPLPDSMIVMSTVPSVKTLGYLGKYRYGKRASSRETGIVLGEPIHIHALKIIRLENYRARQLLVRTAISIGNVAQ